MKNFLFALFLAAPLSAQAQHWVWISPDEIDQLPDSGPAWNSMKAAADRFVADSHFVLANQDDKRDSEAMAAAMVWQRTGDPSYRAAVEAGCLDVIGQEDQDFPGENNTSLELSRNVCAIVIAAELIEWSDPEAEASFRSWVSMIRTYEREDGRSITSTHEDRPNNWGTHAGASRLACSIYLEDWEDVSRCARVFGGWLGVRGLYSGFSYGELCWQADQTRPVGINPRGATLAGISVDGVLPDDQRRSGRCPPEISQENYVYEALQGVTAQAVMFDRLGLEEVWTVRHAALYRAFAWLHEEALFPAEGDDVWQAWVVNKAYDLGLSAFPSPQGGVGHGKSVGWTDWTTQAISWP